MKTKTHRILAAALFAAVITSTTAFGQANRQANAIYIRDNAGITLDTSHPSGISDPGSTARENIVDTAACRTAQTSAYSDVGVTSVWLHSTMLSSMREMREVFGYTYRVSEIAGGDHSSTSYHYRGTAYDVYVINGVGVSASSSNWRTFNQRNIDNGAIETLGPGDAGHDTHVHNAWPSGTANSGPGGCLPTGKTARNVDNPSGTATGTWATGTGATDKLGTDYRYHSTAAVSEPFTWSTTLNTTATWNVKAWWSAGANRSTTAPYIVSHDGATTTVNKNQQANGGVWNLLGSWSMGGAENVKLSCWTGTGFVVIADGIRWD